MNNELHVMNPRLFIMLGNKLVWFFPKLFMLKLFTQLKLSLPNTVVIILQLLNV